MSSIFERVLDKDSAMERFQQQFPKEMNKALVAEWQDFIEKGRKAQIGEIREWRGGKFRKTELGWVPANPSDKLRQRRDKNNPNERFHWDGNLVGRQEYGSPQFEEDLNIYASSESQYKDENGNWTEDRIKKVHQPIVESYVKRGKKGDGEKPTAILMMGAPATGKGHLRKILSRSGTIPEHFLVVDPDEIKTEALSPDYDRYSEDNNKTASPFVHEEGSDISKEIFAALEDKGYDYIQDKVFADAKKLEKEIKRLVSKGYDVQIIATQCPKDLAKERMLKRAKGPQARYVDMKVFEKVHNSIDTTFDWLFNNTPEGVSSVKRYNTESQTVELVNEK